MAVSSSTSPNSMNSEDDSLNLVEVGEKSLWILSRDKVAATTEDVDQEAEAFSEDKQRIKRLTLEKEALKSEKDELKEALFAEEQKIKRLTSENEALKKENEELKERLKLAESGGKDTTKKLKQREEEITSLNRQLQVGTEDLGMSV